jgi:hypothetical protein
MQRAIIIRDLISSPIGACAGISIPVCEFPDTHYTINGSGFEYGLNAGVFVPLGRVAIGGLLNFTTHHFSKFCENDASTYNVDYCFDTSSLKDLKVFGFSGALLY